MTSETTTMRTTASGKRRLGRRAMLGGSAAAAAAGLATRMGATTKAAAQDATPAAEGGRATFVLVHGAWAGAWIWRDLIRLLQAAGHDVYASNATGMGDRVHLNNPGIDLDVYITDVVNMLEYEDLRDVTLVGWSYGGMTITGVAERVPERLAQVVYLDASVPADGQNNHDADMPTAEAADADLVAMARDGIAAGMTGFRVVTPGVEEWIRGSLKDPAVADWVLSKLVPQPLLTYQQPVKLGNPAAAALPRVFILCTADKDLQADPQSDAYVLAAERARSDPNWRVVELADNHLAAINNPQATAEALLSLV
jgi:pimeloyl-ACP methyl ester carboxylesterase